jgi:hypothetical protein
MLTDEDRDAIELLVNSHYAEQVSAWELNFLESISERESLTEKQRATFEAICRRVLK